ncbi:WXG100 family type VII secretion target [Actinoplanes sp. NPDC026619]|uniref:WXG100 family type VII secretion target n=1 Tax=Actinoplanes sp. NPDC026619 TaxID=3155798 RepID=UPI0033C89A54
MGIGDIKKYVIPEKPKGHPDQIDDAAAQWSYYAAHLQGTMDQARSNVLGQIGSWHGEARTAFEQSWTEFAASVDDGCKQMEDVAKKLRSAADDLRVALLAYDAAVAGLVVGAVVTIATLGVGAPEAGAADVAEVTLAVTAAAAAQSAARTALLALADFAAVLAARFVVNFAENVAFEATLNAVARSDHDPTANIHYRDDAEDALTSLFLPGGRKSDSPKLSKSNIAGEGKTSGNKGGSPARKLSKEEKQQRLAEIKADETRKTNGVKKGEPGFDPGNHKSPLGSDFKAGVEDPEGRLLSHEKPIAEYLADKGEMVHARTPDDSPDVKNPDVMVRKGPDDPGTVTEFKSMLKQTEDPSNALKDDILEAADQVDQKGGGGVVVDGRPIGLTDEQAQAAYDRILGREAQAEAKGGHLSVPESIRVILGDGTLKTLR